MIKEEVTITVYENNDPLVTLHVDTEDDNEVLTSYDFTDVDEVSFIVKRGVATPDSDATAIWTVTTGEVVIDNDPTTGNFAVQMDAEALANAGNYRYRVDVLKLDKTETIMLGPFIITNT